MYGVLPFMLVAVTTCALRAVAADTVSAFECRWTDQPITIDGRADEPAWKHAQTIDHFQIGWLTGDARKPRTSTRAKLLWDRDYLYFYAEMEDHDLVATITEHQGRIWTGDVFELFFKPATDKKPYYEFEVNPANATLELFFPARDAGGYDKFKDTTHIELKSAVQLHGTLNHPGDRDDGWSVEGRIPWRDLAPTGGRPNPGDQWRFALCRYDYSSDGREPEQSSSAPLTKPNFHRYEDYSTLKFVGPESVGGSRPYGLEHRVAWTTSHVVGYPDRPPYAVERVFPRLHVERPLYILEEPGTNNHLLLQHLAYWAGPSRLLRFANQVDVDHAQTLLDIDRLVYGMTLHPNFIHNGYIYLIGNGPVQSPVHKDRISRYTIDRNTGRIDPGSERVIIEWDSNGHDGGDLAFGPDGYLYHAAGDGSADSDANLRGQDITHLNSTMIRLDVDHPSQGRNYSIPPDNPFINFPGARPEIWAYGFRNPWRLTFDRHTGQLWVGQNGQDAWEQVYIVHRGENYGWSVYEGSHPFNLQHKRGPTPIVPPLIDHPHSEMRSLTGGVVYYGARFPDLRGAFVYGDWSTGRVWGVKAPRDKIDWHKELARTTLQIVGFRETSSGDLLVIDEGGNGIYKLVPTHTDANASPFPQKLSETGLFASTKDDVPAAGLIPYDVNAPLWSDGAIKERFIAIPGDGTIEMTPAHGWNFPDGTVLVKTFSLPTQGNHPNSTRRVETRLLTRQFGQWAGYSYIWNNEQTDASLVPDSGADRDYTVNDATGTRTQTWHFPSRTECMACHTRASNFVLGLTTLQLNKEHDYRGIKENQLRALEHLGILRVDYMDLMKQALMNEGHGDREADTMIADAATRPNHSPPQLSMLLPTAPENLPHLVDPADPHQDLAARARSYLHANCAICHVKEGGGNALIDLEYTTPLDRMRVLDQVPQHERFNLPDARIIARGHPASSVLYHRMSIRGQGQMPPLATCRPDEQALSLLQEWIAHL